MKTDMSSGKYQYSFRLQVVDLLLGLGQADLSLQFSHHEKGSFIKIKDIQVGLAEFIGTFFLAFVIGATKVTSNPTAQPFAIGTALIALVYTLGPVSGGQLNPAVSLGLVFRNKLNVFEATYCIICQFLGATFAGLFCYALYNNDWNDVGYPKVSDDTDYTRAFVVEMLQTFFLVTVVLNTASTAAQANNSYFGIAIGFVVLTGALNVGGISGGCFNPAIGMLAALNSSSDDLWVYWLAPSVGGILAGLLFRVTNPSEWDDSDPVAKLSRSHHNPEGNIVRTVAMLCMEFIGTFFLVYTVALSVNAGNSNFIAIGFTLVSLVYAGGAISGGHYNPAVTIAVFLKGYLSKNMNMRGIDAVYYIATQLIGGYLGGATAGYVNHGYDEIASPSVNTEHHTYFAALIAEILMTFLLMLCVLCVGGSAKVAGNSYFAFAIGMVVLSGIVTVGDISGAVFNPAVGIVLPSITGRATKDIWVYIFGPIIGAILSLVVFQVWYYDEDEIAIIRKGSKRSVDFQSNTMREPLIPIHSDV